MVEEPTSPSFQFLLEETKRDITPNVTVKVDQNSVETTQRIKQFRHVVMWLDLSGVRVESLNLKIQQMLVNVQAS